MYKRIISFSILITFMLCFIPMISYGFIENILSLKELCMLSSDIVKSEVTALECFKDEKSGRIYTDISITILEKYKGGLNAGDEITFARIGGTFEGVTTFIVGSPNYSIGEKAILFLKLFRTEYNKYLGATNLGQGKFNIFRDKESKQEMVIRHNIMTPLKISNGTVHLGLRDKEVRDKLLSPLKNPEKLKKWGESIPLTDEKAYPLNDFVEIVKLMIEATDNITIVR